MGQDSNFNFLNLTALETAFDSNLSFKILEKGYNGLEITFWSGVFPTCIGQTRQLENRFGVVGLAGILVGVGEILGAGVTMLTGNKEKPPRGPLVCIGMVCHAVAFYLWYDGRKFL